VNNQQQSDLHGAIRARTDGGDPQTVQFLLDHGADPYLSESLLRTRRVRGAFTIRSFQSMNEKTVYWMGRGRRVKHVSRY
jgi:hypothetical protein